MKRAQDGLHEVPIRASLWKSVLLAGADRRVTIIIIGTCMVLVLLSRFGFWPCITAALLGTLGQIAGIKLAAVDTHLIDVYLRHIGYRRVYPARSRLCPIKRISHPSVPSL